MKKLISIKDNLQKQFDRITEITEKRNNTFWDRTEKWQNSDTGQEYEDKTMELEEAKDLLEEAIDKLKEVIEQW